MVQNASLAAKTRSLRSVKIMGAILSSNARRNRSSSASSCLTYFVCSVMSRPLTMMPATAALSRALVDTNSISRISPLAVIVLTVSRIDPLGV